MKNSTKCSPPIESKLGEAGFQQAASSRLARIRRIAGFIGGVLAVVFMVWLPLGILGVVPFTLQIPGESLLRTHAGAAVACLMVTAWAYWEA
jgi:hypothetical protein